MPEDFKDITAKPISELPSSQPDFDKEPYVWDLCFELSDQPPHEWAKACKIIIRQDSQLQGVTAPMPYEGYPGTFIVLRRCPLAELGILGRAVHELVADTNKEYRQHLAREEQRSVEDESRRQRLRELIDELGL